MRFIGLPIRRHLKHIVFTVITVVILIYSYGQYGRHANLQFFLERRSILEPNPPSGYLVRSVKCSIPNLPAFSDDVSQHYRKLSYRKCSDYDLLTYISKTDDSVKLIVREDAVKYYAMAGVDCCFSYVLRNSSSPDPDSDLSYTNCEYFRDVVAVSRSPIRVRCYERVFGLQVYQNAHAFTAVSELAGKRKRAIARGADPIKVLMIGVDSVSRLNLHRAMPLTHERLLADGWIEYLGYNKIGDNTFPNLMAVFTGRNYTDAYKHCHGTTVGNLDGCNFLWYDYARSGFVTAYAEDLSQLNTFNYYRKGFREAPTDFYFRPYVMASETLLDFYYCSGLETTGERMMRLIRDYAATLRDYHTFGVFWMSGFSHDDINHPTMFDAVFDRFLADLQSTGVYDDTIIVFFSDHGMRFGDFRNTPSGWYEERLPLLTFRVPDWFRRKYARKYANLRANFDKLTTPYDLYMTLRDLLRLHDGDDSRAVAKSGACPNCHSLFEPVASERSCEDVAIPAHYCTCHEFRNAAPMDEQLIVAAGRHVVDELNRLVAGKNATLCAIFTLGKTNYARTTATNRDDTSKPSLLVLGMNTRPEAVFEATLRVTRSSRGNLRFKLVDDISRLDSYSEHSKCIDDAILKKYCYCL